MRNIFQFPSVDNLYFIVLRFYCDKLKGVMYQMIDNVLMDFTFIYIFLMNLFLIFDCTGSSLLDRLSLVSVSRGCSSLRYMGFLWWLLWQWSLGSRVQGLSSCSSQAPEHRVLSYGAWA